VIPSRIPLSERLIDEAYVFDYFQAVRLLALISSERPGLGSAEHPSDEVVRFQARQSTMFPASAIHSISVETDPPRMVVSFMGLTGIQGVLPLHYTEHIIARAVAKDFAMADFLDLFNHRLLSLFYRAWEKHNFPARYQLAETRKQPGGLTEYLLALVGLGTNGLGSRHSFSDQALLRYAGLLAQAPHSAVALQQILRDFFGVPVEVEQFVGAWHSIEDDDRCDLRGSGLNNQLGLGAIAGDAAWDPQAGIRLRIGPLSLLRFLAFLPDGDAAKPLEQITRLLTGQVPKVEWQPVLRAQEVPWCRLGDESAVGPRLGWTTWLKTGEFEADADQAIFDLAA
jgi:type VI secretion system protein ImpH